MRQLSMEWFFGIPAAEISGRNEEKTTQGDESCVLHFFVIDIHCGRPRNIGSFFPEPRKLPFGKAWPVTQVNPHQFSSPGGSDIQNSVSPLRARKPRLLAMVPPAAIHPRSGEVYSRYFSSFLLSSSVIRDLFHFSTCSLQFAGLLRPSFDVSEHPQSQRGPSPPPSTSASTILARPPRSGRRLIALVLIRCPSACGRRTMNRSRAKASRKAATSPAKHPPDNKRPKRAAEQPWKIFVASAPRSGLNTGSDRSHQTQADEGEAAHQEHDQNAPAGSRAKGRV